MRHSLTGFVIALAAGAAPAVAQDVWDETAGIETEARYDATVVIAPDHDETFLYTLRGGFDANYVLESGAEVGFRSSGGAEMDHPARSGFSGAAGFALLPVPPAGAFGGLARVTFADDDGPRGRIETAYIYIDGGYGELRAGLDDGVAARFFEGAPTLFRHAALANPGLDPSGQVFARTDHDLTGPSLKVSYATPRILGLRAGVSLAPEANASGLDRDPVRSVGGVAQPGIENAVEIALNLSRRLPRSGVRLRAGAAYSQADAGQANLPGLYDQVETWSAGGSVEFSSLAFGASYLSSNNGFAAGPGDYTALSAAVRLRLGKIDAGLEVSDMQDESLGTESDGVGLSLGRNFGDNLRLTGGWQRLNTRDTGIGIPLAPLQRAESDGVVIEITLSG
jgi:Gram-negative porin